jgi:hypothetical protein
MKNDMNDNQIKRKKKTLLKYSYKINDDEIWAYANLGQ